MTVHAEPGGALGSGPRSRSGVVTATMAVALVMSVTLNVLMAHRIRTTDSVREAAFADRLLKVGTTVPAITAKRVNGGSEVISYQVTSEPTVLYVFTPTCIWCARNLSNLKTLLENDSDHFRFIALSLSDEGVAPYVAKNGLAIPVYSGLSPETKKTYKLGGTPQTIVISPEGRILQNWVGAYVGTQKSQVEAFFHITLPGLVAAPEPSSTPAGGN
jgi:peroxiredoxin